MNRRQILCGTGGVVTLGLAGCAGVLGDSAEYDDDDHDGMVLTLDAFDDENNEWHQDDEFNEHYDACFLTDEEDMVVMALVEIEEDVEAAEDSFSQSESGASDPSEYELADEAWWASDDDLTTTMFRHSNAVGQVAAGAFDGVELSPDENRSQNYANEMFDLW